MAAAIASMRAVLESGAAVSSAVEHVTSRASRIADAAARMADEAAAVEQEMNVMAAVTEQFCAARCVQIYQPSPPGAPALMHARANSTGPSQFGHIWATWWSHPVPWASVTLGSSIPFHLERDSGYQ